MKIVKILPVLVTVMLLTGTPVFAQEQKHEIEAGIGIWNINEILDTFSGMLVSIIPGAKMDDSESYGSIHAGYKYRLTQRIGIGGLFAYDHSTSIGIMNNQEIGKFSNNHYTLAFEMDYIYFRSGFFSMYGQAGLGGTLYTQQYKDYDDSDENDSDSKLYATFQLTPLGFKLGNEFGGFVELGFGYRGILNAGLFFRF